MLRLLPLPHHRRNRAAHPLHKTQRMGTRLSRWITMAAGYTPEKICVCIAVRSYVTTDHVTLRVDPVALATGCAWNIDGDELPIVQDKPVLVSILTVVETDDGSSRVYAGNPCEGGVGNVDRDEFARLPRETMEYTVTAEVGANNIR